MAANEGVLLSLHDGREVAIRPIRSSDETGLHGLMSRLSPESRRFRFFAPVRVLGDKFAHHLANVDGHDRGAIVVTYPGEDDIRAVGRWEAIDADSAEVAFTVEDDLQGQGLGTALVHLVAEALRDGGYHEMIAMVLPDNHAMLDVFRHSGLPCGVRNEGWANRVVMHLDGPSPSP